MDFADDKVSEETGEKEDEESEDEAEEVEEDDSDDERKALDASARNSALAVG